MGKRGGKRVGAGAKLIYGEKTETVSFACPVSRVDEIKIYIKSKLSEWILKYGH